MRVRPIRVAISALLGGALLSACAGGGSSVTQSSATVPSAVQRGTGQSGTLVGRQPHSGVRRTLSAPSCSGTGAAAVVSGGVSNVAGGYYSFVGDGQNNQACDGWSAIVGGFANAVSGSASGDGFIGGGEYNAVIGNDTDSAVVAGDTNTVSNYESAIVGGASNTVSNAYAFIGGGNKNMVSGEYGFIGAGLDNNVSGEGAYIAAGGYNTASGEGAVVDGGFAQTASGTFSTIPGGYRNTASATYSFAAGAFGTAANEGAFVWSDGSNGSTVLTSSHNYQFLARAAGGFTLYTNAGATVGAQLAAGSGTWASLSDRNAKTNIAPLNDNSILAKLDALPISRWSYKTEHGVRHVGPMAQDFYAAFDVGEDDKHITSIDEDGVALAAIKALHSRVASLDAENARIRAKDAAQIGQLRRRLAADEAHERRVDAELSRIVATVRR